MSIPKTEKGSDKTSGLKQRVLVVDDVKTHSKVIRKILENCGYEVHLADNGIKAFFKLKSIPEKFDLIILDIMMPVMDGYATLKKIRSDNGLKNIPVLMCTAKGDEQSRHYLAQIDIQGYLIKPFNAEALINKTQQIIASANKAQSIQANENGVNSAVNG